MLGLFNAEASLKTICAFANDIDNWGGGYLVIDVEEKDGRPVHPLKGVPADKVDGISERYAQQVKSIQPEYLPIVEVVDYQDKKFIVVWGPGRYLRPYSSPKLMAKEEKELVCYIRKMSSTIMPSEEEKWDLYNLANNIPFDDRVNHEADIVDLNLTLIQAYLKEVESFLYEESKHMDFVDLCRSMNIINTLLEYTKPKNVGLMFSGWSRTVSSPMLKLMWSSSRRIWTGIRLLKRHSRVRFTSNCGRHSNISETS